MLKRIALFIPLLLIAQPSEAIQFKFWPGGVSTRRKELAGEKITPQTMHILALRVRFQKEDPDDPNTTGDGTFDLSNNSKEERINPAPHNRSYFERQLESLKNYYQTVSEGNLNLTYHVFPQEEDSSYLLPHLMAYYNPLTSAEATDRRLAELFRDAVVVADTADTTIHFSHYDAFVIFHAGVGGDVSFYWDPTPKDIPSAFFNLDDLRKYLGGGDPNYQGIAVDIAVNEDTFYVREGLWLPETENQQEYEIGLNGVFAKLFAHQLGLPNLYNTLDGNSGIGQWGLMDQGCWNVDGLIPAQPCAWSKVFLGWVEPLVVYNKDSVKVATSALKSGIAKAVKVPINSREYFLIENRQRDICSDDTVCVWEEGVLTSVDEYDWGIPGSGILIWHIDENVIEEKLADNLINSDPLHRGVDLEEADGFQDIGHIIEGYYITYGMPEDAFYKGNKSKNYRNAFTPSTRPNTNSNSGAYSHIYITDFSSQDSVMSFKVGVDYNQPGWPEQVGTCSGEFFPTFGDLDGDGRIEILAATPEGKIYAWKAEGTPLSYDSTGLFVDVMDSLLCSPTLADLDEDGDLEVVEGTGKRMIYAWRVNFNGEAEPLSGFPVHLDSLYQQKVVGISIGDLTSDYDGPEIVIKTLGESPAILSANGEILTPAGPSVGVGFTSNVVLCDVDDDGWMDICQGVIGSYPQAQSCVTINDYENEHKGTITIPSKSHIIHLAAGDINRDGIIDIVGTTSDGGVFAGKALGDSSAYWFCSTYDPHLSPPALGDIDADGYLEIILSGDNKIYAFNYNGSLVTNFPIAISRSHPVGPLNSSPALADVDGDGKIDIVVGSPQGELFAFHSDASKVKGWPLSCGGPVSSSPAFLDVDNDDSLEVMVGSEDGWLYIWRLLVGYNPDKIPWPMRDYDVAHTGFYQGIYPQISPAKLFFSPDLAYNWPNPFSDCTHIRYWLGEEASVEIKIFDLAGNLIDQFSGAGYSKTENEVLWYGKNSHGKDVASGVYLCRIEAKSGNQKKVAFVKMALVR